MKIVTIEDNKNLNDIIYKDISRLLIINNYDYDIYQFCTYNERLEKIIYTDEIKIYIIDIKLGKYTGYDICRIIREAAYDWNSIIIICSAHNEQEKIISLRLSIFTYISKRHSFRKNLADSILSAINILEHNRFWIINSSSKIEINNIYYILKEKKSKYCLIKTEHETLRIRSSLKALNQKLGFKKMRNYILINENNAKLITKDKIIFKNGIEIEF